MALVFVVIVVVVAMWLASVRGQPALVVYCAHDLIYSKKILIEFEKQTGIRIAVRFDTEATKSLGLTELLIREKNNPRCDVFWNNEQLGTMQLMEHGLLEPYKGSGFRRIPAAYKELDGHWVGFAARMRVWIINTDRMTTNVQVIQDILKADLSRVAIARPLYGTTRTHYTVLWNQWGSQKLTAWHADWRARHINEVQGNATVKNLVSAGICDLGLTDSDDFFVAKDDGQPVTMLPVRLEDGAVICIPNTVSIIKGTKQATAARELVDFLLSQQTELALAHSKSRQIPLGPIDPQTLPEPVRQLMEWAATPYPLDSLGESSRSCLDWLRSEYVK